MPGTTNSSLFTAAGNNFMPQSMDFGALTNLSLPNMSMPTANLGASANLAGGLPEQGNVPFTTVGQANPNTSFWERLGLVEDGKLNWDNLASGSKGLTGIAGLGLNVANYYQQKDQNADMTKRYDESLARQQKLDALNAMGQRRYMSYKGWGTAGERDKYNRLVDELTNTSLA